MYESLLTLPGGLFAEFDRMQRDLQQLFGTPGLPSSIRAVAQGAFPPINLAGTPSAFEVYAFAPGLDPKTIEVTVDRGLLTISGERVNLLSAKEGERSVYASERYEGSFRRTVSLPEDADPRRIQAKYRDGVLRITVARRESAQPKRVTVN
jgi:HSP20 family protein